MTWEMLEKVIREGGSLSRDAIQHTALIYPYIVWVLRIHGTAISVGKGRLAFQEFIDSLTTFGLDGRHLSCSYLSVVSDARWKVLRTEATAMTAAQIDFP